MASHNNNSVSPRQDRQARIRDTALKHAMGIEEKKKLQARVLDLVLEAYDLPSDSSAGAARPNPADRKVFEDCLALFRPSDLDDLVKERNIDARCGYALCPKLKKTVLGGGEKVWNGQSGSRLKFVERADMEQWCSKQCQERNSFVRAQLINEPAWLREAQNVIVRLLDDVQAEQELAQSAKSLGIDSEGDEMARNLNALSLERGQLNVSQDSHVEVSIFERTPQSAVKAPTPARNELIEGLPTRKFDAKGAGGNR